VSNPSLDANWISLNQEIMTCRACPRLVEWREQVAREKRRAYRDCDYWGKPVTGFGDSRARLVVVGLAPGAHGANRTGRVFTGDGAGGSGDFLYGALYRAGFATQPMSRYLGDSLALHDAFVTCMARCAPPANRPTAQELANCRGYLVREFELLRQVQVIVALGHIAFDGCLRTLNQSAGNLLRLKFGHARHYPLSLYQPDLPHLIASYHPSRQNTQTGRLTEAMIDTVFQLARSIIDSY
jgi:uracil-DNA glycosylase family 4